MLCLGRAALAEALKDLDLAGGHQVGRETMGKGGGGGSVRAVVAARVPIMIWGRRAFPTCAEYARCLWRTLIATVKPVCSSSLHLALHLMINPTYSVAVDNVRPDL